MRRRYPGYSLDKLITIAKVEQKGNVAAVTDRLPANQRAHKRADAPKQKLWREVVADQEDFQPAELDEEEAALRATMYFNKQQRLRKQGVLDCVTNERAISRAAKEKRHAHPTRSHLERERAAHANVHTHAHAHTRAHTEREVYT